MAAAAPRGEDAPLGGDGRMRWRRAGDKMEKSDGRFGR